MNIEYTKPLSDDELFSLVDCGDRAAENIIVSRYAVLAERFAGRYFISGADSDDVVQEGYIGLLEAVRCFDRKRSTPFCAFAELCISRRIYAAMRNALRMKNEPLNLYISLNNVNVFSEASDPENIIICREELYGLISAVNCRLSVFEKNVLKCFLQSMSYRETAHMLKTNEKAIDNAMVRLRRKLCFLKKR